MWRDDEVSYSSGTAEECCACCDSDESEAEKKGKKIELHVPMALGICVQLVDNSWQRADIFNASLLHLDPGKLASNPTGSWPDVMVCICSCIYWFDLHELVFYVTSVEPASELCGNIL